MQPFSKKKIFIYFWLHRVLVSAHETSHCGVRTALSSCGARAPELVGSVLSAHGVSSWDSRA